MPKTSIEWTDFSVNPIRARNKATGAVGHYCEKISKGCQNCYSSNFQKRFRMPAFNEQRGDDNIEVFLDESKLHDVIKRKKPTKFFWCDMTDMFGEWVPDGFIDKCFAAMALSPQHTHQVLTKRPERMRQYFGDLNFRQEQIGIEAEAISGFDRFDDDGVTIEPRWQLPFDNCWLGISCEDQKTADERIPHLLSVSAKVHFLSCEPLLGALNLNPYLDKIDQVIVGGESGHGARPMHPSWARDLRDQCVAAGVAFHFKQWGNWMPYQPTYDHIWKDGAGNDHDGNCLDILDPETGEENKGWDAGFWCVGERLPDCSFKNVGKHAAGRLLDGRTWDEFPEATKMTILEALKDKENFYGLRVTYDYRFLMWNSGRAKWQVYESEPGTRKTTLIYSGDSEAAAVERLREG